MMQAAPRLHHFLARDFSERDFRKLNSRCIDTRGRPRSFLAIGCFCAARSFCSGKRKRLRQPRLGLSPEKASAWRSKGAAARAFLALSMRWPAHVAADTRKQAGVLGVRCSLAIDDRDSADEFIRLLNKQFSKDPDVLFVVVHAYSDLSTRTAQDLGRTAPNSFAAHKLNAEALEMQGKWEPAQLEYEGMIQKDPNARGIHFLLGRLLFSRPDAGRMRRSVQSRNS